MERCTATTDRVDAQGRRFATVTCELAPHLGRHAGYADFGGRVQEIFTWDDVAPSGEEVGVRPSDLAHSGASAG